MQRDIEALVDIVQAAKHALTYDDVDLTIVWDTLQNDIPRLIALIEPLIR